MQVRPRSHLHCPVIEQGDISGSCLDNQFDVVDMLENDQRHVEAATADCEGTLEPVKVGKTKEPYSLLIPAADAGDIPGSCVDNTFEVCERLEDRFDVSEQLEFDQSIHAEKQTGTVVETNESSSLPTFVRKSAQELW